MRESGGCIQFRQVSVATCCQFAYLRDLCCCCCCCLGYVSAATAALVLVVVSCKIVLLEDLKIYSTLNLRGVKDK